MARTVSFFTVRHPDAFLDPGDEPQALAAELPAHFPGVPEPPDQAFAAGEVPVLGVPLPGEEVVHGVAAEQRLLDAGPPGGKQRLQPMEQGFHRGGVPVGQGLFQFPQDLPTGVPRRAGREVPLAACGEEGIGGAPGGPHGPVQLLHGPGQGPAADAQSLFPRGAVPDRQSVFPGPAGAVMASACCRSWFSLLGYSG